MATPKQKEFVADIESGVSALILEECKVKQITQVLDRAGYKTADLAPYLHRLRMGEDWELIERLSTAFLRVGLVPPCVAKALEHSPKSKAVPKLSDLDPEPLELERTVPIEPVQVRMPEPKFEIMRHEPTPLRTASAVLAEITAILDPLNPAIQKKVIGAAMAWYEVGG